MEAISLIFTFTIMLVFALFAYQYGLHSQKHQHINLEKNMQALEKETHYIRETLKKIREQVRNDPVFEYQYVDVILLGPRQAGKTSIGKRWTSPWTQITKISASTDWQVYESNIYEFQQMRRKDDLFGVSRIHKPILRLRVRDYPGEPDYRSVALRDLNRLGSKVIVLFIFKVGFENNKILYADDNAEYFSRVFVEETEKHLKRISNHIAKAVIVFNKVDILQHETHWSNDEIFQKLKHANYDAVHQIERIFSGSLDYHLTSAFNEQGIVSLLGEIGREAIPEQHLQEYSKLFNNLGDKTEL